MIAATCRKTFKAQFHTVIMARNHFYRGFVFILAAHCCVAFIVRNHTISEDNAVARVDIASDEQAATGEEDESEMSPSFEEEPGIEGEEDEGVLVTSEETGSVVKIDDIEEILRNNSPSDEKSIEIIDASENILDTSQTISSSHAELIGFSTSQQGRGKISNDTAYDIIAGEIEDQLRAPPNIYACSSKECIDFVKTLQEPMNVSVNPCEDFYEYACGNWEQIHPNNEGKRQITRFSLERMKIAEQLRDDLMSPKVETDGKAVQMAKDMFQSCLNEGVIEERGEGPIKDLINSFGGWPLLLADKWRAETFDFELVAAKLAVYSMNNLIQPQVSADQDNPTHYVLKLRHHAMRVPSYVFLHKGHTKAYKTYIKEVAKLLGATGDDKQTRDDITDIIKLEKTVCRTKPAPRSYIRDAFQNVTVAELQAHTGHWFNWSRFLNAVFKEIITDRNILIGDDEPVVIVSIQNLYGLLDLLKSTPKRILSNYLIWTTVRDTTHLLSENFRNISMDFEESVYGGADEHDRWSHCVRQTNKLMPSAVGRIYVKDNFDIKSKMKVLEIVDAVRTAFISNLDNVKWMDDLTKVKAKDKANVMKALIGYNDYILDDDLLFGDYRQVNIDPERFFENSLSLRINTVRLYLRSLRQPVDRDSSMILKPATLNAHMIHIQNVIVFTAAVMKPLFQQYYPNYINYAGIGVTIGHEIIHGFDDFGHRFNADGRLEQWWDDDTLEHFKTKARCTIDQYSNFTMPNGMKLNPVLTNGENIADNGGIKFSYKAYQAWIKQNGPEPLLPGLGFNQHQLFFLNYAQLWCSTYRDSYLRHSIRTNPHTPGKFRVNGPLVNFPEFSEAFRCPVDSPMNPRTKCTIW